MIEMKCPSCGAAGRIPPYKVNVRLICKKCLKPFHITSCTQRGARRSPRCQGRSQGGKPARSRLMKRTEAIDEMAARLSKLKLPQVSPRALGMTVARGPVHRMRLLAVLEAISGNSVRRSSPIP